MEIVNTFLAAWAMLAMLLSPAAAFPYYNNMTGFNASLPSQPLSNSLYSNGTAGQMNKTAAAQKYSWWVDSSCRDRSRFDDYLADAREMACAATRRVNSNSDHDFETVFRHAFKDSRVSNWKYEKSQTWQRRFRDTRKKSAFEHVTYVFKSLCQDWAETANRDEATLRFTCNSGRTFSEEMTGEGAFSAAGRQIYLDPVNGVAGYRECQENPGGGTSGGSAPFGYMCKMPAAGYPNLPEDRGVMVLCDRVFVDQERLHVAGTTSDLKTRDLSDYKADEFSYMPGMVILHEWMHTHPYLLEDIPNYDWLGRPIPGSAYGWVNNNDKSAAVALTNADTYAWVGFWALMADSRRPNPEQDGNGMRGGWTLPRVPAPQYPDVARQEAEKMRKDGRMFCYTDITR